MTKQRAFFFLQRVCVAEANGVKRIEDESKENVFSAFRMPDSRCSPIVGRSFVRLHCLLIRLFVSSPQVRRTNTNKQKKNEDGRRARSGAASGDAAACGETSGEARNPSSSGRRGLAIRSDAAARVPIGHRIGHISDSSDEAVRNRSAGVASCAEACGDPSGGRRSQRGVAAHTVVAAGVAIGGSAGAKGRNNSSRERANVVHDAPTSVQGPGGACNGSGSSSTKAPSATRKRNNNSEVSAARDAIDARVAVQTNARRCCSCRSFCGGAGCGGTASGSASASTSGGAGATVPSPGSHSGPSRCSATPSDAHHRRHRSGQRRPVADFGPTVDTHRRRVACVRAAAPARRWRWRNRNRSSQ